VRDRTSATGNAGANTARSSATAIFEVCAKAAPVLIAAALLLSGVIGAERASAATCTYNPATNTINITIDPGDKVELAIDGDGADLDPAAPDGSILMREDAGPYQACGSATNGNTVAIIVLGSPASSETFTLDDLVGGTFATAIDWAVDLGSGDDTVIIDASEDIGDTIVLADRGFTLNGGRGELLGVDIIEVLGNGGNDRIDASARSTGSTLSGLDGVDGVIGGGGDDDLSGGDDDDRVTGGAGDDLLDGGAGVDRLYGGEGTDTCVLDSLRLGCDPSISVEPSTVPSGGSVIVTGAGWYPENGNVELLLDPPGDASIPPFGPDPQAWTIEGTVDAPSAAVTYLVTACQPCSDPAAESPEFSLIVQSLDAPALSVEPPSVHVGDVAVVSGQDWDPEAGPISLFTDTQFPAGEPFAIMPAAEAIRFERDFEVPQLSPGTHEVIGCQRCSDPDPIVERAAFTVEPASVTTATLELHPPEGSPGDLVRVVGTGWDPADGEVSIFVDPSAGTKRDAVLQPDPDETFDVELEVPDLDEGSYTVLACQRCNVAGRIERTVTLTVSPPAPDGSSLWWWILLGSAVVVGAIVITALAIRARERWLRKRIRVRPRFDDPEVQLLAEPDGSPHHTIELIPHADPGVQRVLEGSST
jgi:RTX calcium-binding nonapeptide repeat (4 copies)